MSLSVTNDSGKTKKIKVLGIGSGGSHHMLFQSSDGKTMLECGDMGAMSRSTDGGKTFKPIVSSTDTKDADPKQTDIPSLFAIAEYPENPDWLFGVGGYGTVSFSKDRGEHWITKNMRTGAFKSFNIIIKKEGNDYIAYMAAGYKHGVASQKFGSLAAWVNLTKAFGLMDIKEGTQKFYGAIRKGISNTTGPDGKYYGDITNLQGELFVAGHGGLFSCKSACKNDSSWKNITDSLFTHKDGVYPIDHAISIGDTLYVFAYGDYDDTENTLGVYVHKKGEVDSNGKAVFKRLYKGLKLSGLHHYNNSRQNRFSRLSGLLLKHKAQDGDTYLYLLISDTVYRLNISKGSDTFELLNQEPSGTYSKGYIVGQRHRNHWAGSDNGATMSFDKSDEFGQMTFTSSYDPGFGGINTAYSFGGNIYVSNISEFKISTDDGVSFDTFSSSVANSDSQYDGKLKGYYENHALYELAFGKSKHTTLSNGLTVTPSTDARSFWWSTIKNRGMDNMVTTDVAINPNDPNEIMQSYMDTGTFYSHDGGESWHNVAGLNALRKDTYWVLWIKDAFYAQDSTGIYKFNKKILSFEKKLDLKAHDSLEMRLDENVRVRRYYDAKSDTLVLAGYGAYNNASNARVYRNNIVVMKNFTTNSPDISISTDERRKDKKVYFDGTFGTTRSFKDIWLDEKYVYAINSEFGIIKLPLNNLPSSYLDKQYHFGLNTNEHVLSGLFDKHGNAFLTTASITPDGTDEASINYNYNIRYYQLIYQTKPFSLKSVDLSSKTVTTIVQSGDGIEVDGKKGVVSGKSMLTLLGIDNADARHIFASITNTRTTIESHDGGKTWNEYIPPISGNFHRHQAGNIVFAPKESPFELIILGTGSCYGVMKD
jgi:photosystem II stability/assembly factor-like uncharacterized protein